MTSQEYEFEIFTVHRNHNISFIVKISDSSPSPVSRYEDLNMSKRQKNAQNLCANPIANAKYERTDLTKEKCLLILMMVDALLPFSVCLRVCDTSPTKKRALNYSRP